MKTNDYFLNKIAIFFFFGMFALMLTSCGSYQNSSYYSDGIYGENEAKRPNNYNENSKYKDYFYNLQQDNQQPEVITDVDKYSSVQGSGSTTDSNNQNYSNSNYSSWGSNPDNVTVNIYGGNNWGYNSWWGYSNPYYSYGWYSPHFGWGYNNYWGGNYWGGWYDPFFYPSYYYGYNYGYYHNYNHFGYGRNYVYDQGRRGSSYARFPGNYSGYNGRRDIGSLRNYQSGNSPRNFSTRTNNDAPTRNYAPRTDSNSPRNYAPRTNYPSNNGNQTYNPRSYTPTTNTQSNPRSYTPSTNSQSTPRSYTPSQSSSPRSSSGGGSYGGGGGGGGRSGGGGGRR